MSEGRPQTKALSTTEVRLRALLTHELRGIYENGLVPAEPPGWPVLSDLSEALRGRNPDNQTIVFSDSLEETLKRAIGSVRGDGNRRAARRQEGLLTLLGIAKDRGGNLMRRRDEAADLLGFRSGEALRKTVRDGRPVIDLFLDEIVTELINLGSEHGHVYWKLIGYGSFYPQRPVYDYDSLDWNAGRYGAVDHRPVFNSFINVPNYGDERAFFDGRRTDDTIGSYDPVHDVTHGTREVYLRAYVHNMAYVFEDDPYSSTAFGTRIAIKLPTATAQVLRASALIWADNAEAVEDTCDLISDWPFSVEYLPGSAQLMRYHHVYKLSDTIVAREGALIGQSVMDGIFPAGNQFEHGALVRITVRILPASA